MSKIALSPSASGTGTFTIASPNSNSDRTLNLPDAAGTLATQDYVGTQAIGVGQTWQDMIASRVVGTTYTNTTGRPIQILVCGASSTQFTIFSMEINGLAVSFGRAAFSGSSDFAAITATIPNNATYRIVTGGTNNWLELR